MAVTTVSLKRIQRSFIVSPSPLVSRCTAVLMHVSPKINASTHPAVVHRLLACLPPLLNLTSSVSLLPLIHHHHHLHLSSLCLFHLFHPSSLFHFFCPPQHVSLVSPTAPLPLLVPVSHPCTSHPDLPKPVHQSISGLVKIRKHRLPAPFRLAQPGTASTTLPSQFESSEAVTSWKVQRPRTPSENTMRYRFNSLR